MGYFKNSSKREIYSNKQLRKKKWNILIQAKTKN